MLSELRGSRDLGTVADIGCGKLRHYKILCRSAKALFLVDTERQMAATHRDGTISYTIPDVAAVARKRGRRVYALTVREFCDRRRCLDVAFCVAVFDVVVREQRQQITMCVSDKLRDGGHFVVVIPRNDSTITRRCGKENEHKDGHVFSHHGLQTFFCNFSRYEPVIKDCEKVNLELVRDLSSYRQVCLVFRKNGDAPSSSR